MIGAAAQAQGGHRGSRNPGMFHFLVSIAAHSPKETRGNPRWTPDYRAVRKMRWGLEKSGETAL
jgi:hypothetical protein